MEWKENLFHIIHNVVYIEIDDESMDLVVDYVLWICFDKKKMQSGCFTLANSYEGILVYM